MQLAEAEIEQLLDWTEATGSPELVQIEEVVLKEYGKGSAKAWRVK